MKAKVIVLQERENKFSTKMGMRTTQMLAVVEVPEPGQVQFIQGFDYELSEDEHLKWSGKMAGKTIMLGISELNVFAGRIRVKGAILGQESVK